MSLALLTVSLIGGNLVPGDRLPTEQLRRLASWFGDISTWTQISLVAAAVAAFWVRVLIGRNPAQRAMEAFADRRLERFLIRVEGVLSAARPTRLLRWLAGPEDIEAVSRLNADAFSSSFTYGGEHDAKLRRNAPLLAKVPKTFVFVHDDGRDIGFSSIIPLTPNFTDQYLNGLISDHNLVPEMMPNRNESCGSLVLFAIALDPGLERARGKMKNLRHIRTLVAAHAEHLGEMLRDYGGGTTPIIVQAEKASILRALRSAGFKVAGRKGGDGDLLLTSTLNTLLSRFAPSAHLKAA